MNGMPPNMADMMNNPMVKEMMNNPEMMKMASQMMGQMGGAGADPAKMQEMMQNPSLAKILDNPDFLASTVGMLKNPAARPQLEQVAGQVGISPETLVRVLEFFVSCAYGYKRVSPAVPFLKYGLIILVVAYLLKWLGFTEGLFFTAPFY